LYYLDSLQPGSAPTALTFAVLFAEKRLKAY